MNNPGSYREFRPSKALQPFIDCFWSSRHPPGTSLTFRILPDACADIIFDFTGNDIPLYMVGIATTFTNKDIRGMSEFFGIRFRPGGLYPFIGQPVNFLTNQKIAVKDLSEVLYNALSAIVRPEMQDAERIQNAERLLTRMLGNTTGTQIDYISGSVDYIFKNNGIMNIRSIADHACTSERQLQRKFMERVGVSAKTLSNIVRFMHTRSLAKVNPEYNMIDLADEGGYFDHSHLYREFRRFSGRIPG